MLQLSWPFKLYPLGNQESDYLRGDITKWGRKKNQRECMDEHLLKTGCHTEGLVP